MKKDFLKFQVSKEAMNELRGGAAQICHCKSGGNVFQINTSDFEELDKQMTAKCGDNIGWACSPLKL